MVIFHGKLLNNHMVTRKTLEDDGNIMQVHEQVCPEMVFSVLFCFVSWVLWWLKWDLSDQTWGISLIDGQTQICYQKAPKMGKTLWQSNVAIANLPINGGIHQKIIYTWWNFSCHVWFLEISGSPIFGSPIWQWIMNWSVVWNMNFIFPQYMG